MSQDALINPGDTPDGRVPPAIAQFLVASTPTRWVDDAERNIELILLDHANCELKAASTALALLHRYPQRPDLTYRMSRLAREELRHFEQVGKLIDRLGVTRRPVSASRYASTLRTSVRRVEPGRLVDTLIVGALIEARSCERFALLGPRLEQPLRGFYAGLLASEARHFQHYLALARGASRDDAIDFDQRLGALREAENDLARQPDGEVRFHSGPTAA
jgi:tRNA-(ms[2]io[6]A)-hydroxylase